MSYYFTFIFLGILPLLEPGSVIVLDNASYHTRKSEKIPTTSWRKADIINWLKTKNVEIDPSMVKQELINLVALHRPTYERYSSNFNCINKKNSSTFLRERMTLPIFKHSNTRL